MFASANLSSLAIAVSNAPISHIGFFLSLVVFEVQLYRFWVDGTLGQILVEMAGISVMAFLCGRRALAEVRRRRPGKP